MNSQKLIFFCKSIKAINWKTIAQAMNMHEHNKNRFFWSSMLNLYMLHQFIWQTALIMSAPKYTLALVTGASLGIGKGVALRLAREGIKVNKTRWCWYILSFKLKSVLWWFLFLDVVKVKQKIMGKNGKFYPFLLFGHSLIK